MANQNTNSLVFSAAKFALNEWGVWFLQENAVQALGYPRMSSFMKSYTDGGGYNQIFSDTFGDVSPTITIVQRALLHEPILYQIAQTSHVYKKNQSVRLKANWLQTQKGLFLGNSEKSREIKYKSLESQMLGYVQGYLMAIDD